MAFVGIPVFTYAGVFSFISDLITSKSVVSEAAVVNSRNIELLQAALNPDPNPAKGGGDITIVGGTALMSETGPSGSVADIEDSQSNGQISIYVVRSGDTLGAIAKMFGVSVNTVIWANDIKGSIIKEGQTLVILPISGVRYVVKTGDTVNIIAKNYKADAEEIIRYNNLSEGAKLVVGNIIVIPDGEVTVSSLSLSSGTNSASRLRGAGGPLYEGYYLRPILGGRKTQGLHGYNGVDLATYLGAPVFASADGNVIVNQNYGWNGGYGKYMVINHDNGTQTLYAHLSEALIKGGTRVVRGQMIGLVGSTGRSTGPHLHFEIRGAKNPF